MKSKCVAVILLVTFIATLSSTPVHSQSGGTCGQFQRLDAGTRGFPSFVPFGSENDTSNWWVIQTLNGNLPVTSTGEEIDPIANYGRNIRIWNPEFNSGGGLESISNYEFVDTCAPVAQAEISLTADQMYLTQGQCTILRYSIPSGWSLINIFGFQWLANGYRGASIQDSQEVCPTTTTTYTISGNYSDGVKQASIVITVSVPPPPPSPTRMPTSTRVSPTTTRIPPTWTSIPPTQRIISTIVIPPPVTDMPVQSQLVGLQVQPINQLIPAGSKMKNGEIDYGQKNCAVASTAMAYQYFQSNGVLDENDITDYLAVRDKLRCQEQDDYDTICKGVPMGINYYPYNDLAMEAILVFTPELTHNKLKAKPYDLEPEHFEETIRDELDAGYPIIAVVPDWSVLPGHSGWARAAHSILIHGLQDGKLYYIDPWGGTPQEISVKTYIRSALFEDKKLFIMLFEPTR